MAICCLVVSCKKDTPEVTNLKGQLAASVDGSELGIDLKYELIGIQFVDTIYYGDTIKHYAEKLERYWQTPDKETLISQAGYVEVCLGKNNKLYKMLDSLANLTTPIEKYDYDYIYANLSSWYLLQKRKSDYGDLLDPTTEYYKIHSVMTNIEFIKEYADIYNEMKLHAPDEIYGYRIKHDYKIFNPLLNCEQTLSEIITVNSKLEIL